MTIDNENYFDVAEAMHCFLSVNHEGQTSEKYAALCQSEFKPGVFWSESNVKWTNEYFNEITEENWSEINGKLTAFLSELKESVNYGQF